METHYQKNYVKELSQPEVSIPLAYKSDFSFEDKERIFKEIYSNIALFERLIYEAKKDI